jgi:hypothetical protein
MRSPQSQSDIDAFGTTASDDDLHAAKFGRSAAA